uniref:Uncharacterized protein n=1 Tax=Myoviridae sp. ct8ME27 TaxID=2826622 RepID=A0A8S5N7K8_9CAUD|nr:MAG TPA: hypothetical protein [Myoviridae sp. ct8ME27]
MLISIGSSKINFIIPTIKGELIIHLLFEARIVKMI